MRTKSSFTLAFLTILVPLANIPALAQQVVTPVVVPEFSAVGEAFAQSSVTPLVVSPLPGAISSEESTLAANATLDSLPLQASATDVKIAELESQLQELRSAIYRPHSCKPTCSKQCGSRGGLVAGLSTVFIKPQMKESFESTVLDFGTGSFNLIPFDYDYDATPRLWLGLFNENGMGVRGRYWQYDHNANSNDTAATFTTFPGVSSITVIFPATISTQLPGDVLSVGSGLEIHTVDFEGAYSMSLLGLNLLASAGVRYASLEQQFSSAVTRGPATIGSLDWTRKFEGVGATLGAEANKPLGSTAFSFVGSARGAFLYGEKELRRTTVGDVTPPSAAVPPNVVLDDADEVTAVFELTTGLQWSRPTQCGNLFFRGTYEAQLWTEGGAPTLTFLGLEGFGFSIGIDR